MAGVVLAGLMSVAANGAKGAEKMATTDSYAAVSGKDTNPGTVAAPFAAPAKGISAAAQTVRDKINLKASDGCSHIYGFNYQPSWGSNGVTVWGEKFDPKKYREELASGKKYFFLADIRSLAKNRDANMRRTSSSRKMWRSR